MLTVEPNDTTVQKIDLEMKITRLESETLKRLSPHHLLPNPLASRWPFPVDCYFIASSAFDFNVTIIIFGWSLAFIPCRALRRNLWRVPVPTVHPPHPEIIMMSGCRQDQLPMALPSLWTPLAPENTPFSSSARSA